MTVHEHEPEDHCAICGAPVPWDDIVKFIRWSANVRDDRLEAIAVARELLARIEGDP